MNEANARELIQNAVGQSMPSVVFEYLEKEYGFCQRLCDGEEPEGVLKDAQPVFKEMMTVVRGAASWRSPVTPPAKTYTAEIQFDEDDKMVADALAEYFENLAAEWPQVRKFREVTLGGARSSTDEIQRHAELGTHRLSGEQRQKAIESFLTEHPFPPERLLTEEEALALLQSPAACVLSLDQFRKWDIPVVGHTAIKGVPLDAFSELKLGNHDGPMVTLTFQPSEQVVVVRAGCAARSGITIDGFKAVRGRKPPDFPARTDVGDTSGEAVYAAMLELGHTERTGDLTPEDEALQSRLRERLEERAAFLPTRREESVGFEKTLKYRKPRRNSKTGEKWFAQEINVWPGSVLDDLRGIASSLAEMFHWDDYWATWFVLTGQAPFIQPLRASTTTIGGGYFNDAHISIKALPWVSAETVHRVYDRMRRELVGDNRKCHRNTVEVFRFITRKVGAHIADKDLRWPGLLNSWNEEHPDANLDNPSRFRQCYNRAKNHLLRRDYNEARRRAEEKRKDAKNAADNRRKKTTARPE